MKNNISCILLLIIITFIAVARLFSATGCDLNDPDRDVSRIFPGYTKYKTDYLSLNKTGGSDILPKIEKALGDKFSGLYENIDVPYTLYTVYKDTQQIGYIHGVNQKGSFGGIQVFLALDNKGIILKFYIQKLTSKGAKQLRSESFANQFTGLSLKEFYHYNIPAGKFENMENPPVINNPALKAADDYRSILRAVKKNLVLMQEFVYKKN